MFLITMIIPTALTHGRASLTRWVVGIGACLLTGAASASGATLADEDPTVSPLCFMSYDESYSGERFELLPDSTVSVTWPVVPAKGYVEVRGAVSGNGDHYGVSRQRWGVKWVDRGGDIYKVSVSWGNTNFGDFTDRRYLRADVIKNDSIVDTHYYYTDVDLYDGPNTLAIEYENDKLSVSVGSHRMAESFASSYTVAIPDTLEVWTATTLKVSGIDSRSWPDYGVLYPPQWTYDELYDHIANSADSMEAFWSYFDRVIASETTQVGGRYLLATVANDDGGYDIVMVGGERVNPSIWPCGTLKGRLTPTIFIDTYTLSWRDATGRWIHRDNDLSATVTNASALTLRFPHVGSTLRFSRMPVSQMRPSAQ